MLSIRKTERDILQRNAIKRKLISTLRRMSSTRKRSIESDSEDLGDDESKQIIQPKKSRRINVEITPKDSGFLRVDNKDWPKLEDDQRKFIQKYNSNVWHNEDVNRLVAPDGITIKQKARRNQNKSDDETNDSDSTKNDQDELHNQHDSEEEEPKSKKQKVCCCRKKIRFPLIEDELIE